MAGGKKPPNARRATRRDDSRRDRRIDTAAKKAGIQEETRFSRSTGPKSPPQELIRALRAGEPKKVVTVRRAGKDLDLNVFLGGPCDREEQAAIARDQTLMCCRGPAPRRDSPAPEKRFISPSIITKKRDGGRLSPEEIAEFMGGFVRGEVPEYQMSALAMAIYFRGMDAAETASLVEVMLKSEATLQWPKDFGTLVDKHSTGGIGDKTSLVIAPLLACCGLKVPMISGRGLGATGGTLDKLESIPGFRTNLSTDEIRNVVKRVGCVITGATADLVPADRKLYALRTSRARSPVSRLSARAS